MTPEEYAASQYLITAGVAAYVQRVASFFRIPALGPREWLDFLRLLFPEVQKRYTQSAELGRTFYDAQRKKHHPDVVRNDVPLSELKFEWFVQNMEPTRLGMSQPDTTQIAVTKVALSAVREVEMAGRRQVIGAVKDDPFLEEKLDALYGEDEEDFFEEDNDDDEVESEVVEKVRKKKKAKVDIGRPVIGWARVATGRETCAWCLMLISRGAELNHKGNFAYAEAVTGGINLDDETALDFFKDAGGDPVKFLKKLRKDSKENVERWHVGCDCVAVPVFDLDDWPGMDQARDALQLWIDAAGVAEDLIESGKSRTKNRSTETLNALRRRLERGDISMSNYAAAA